MKLRPFVTQHDVPPFITMMCPPNPAVSDAASPSIFTLRLSNPTSARNSAVHDLPSVLRVLVRVLPLCKKARPGVNETVLMSGLTAVIVRVSASFQLARLDVTRIESPTTQSTGSISVSDVAPAAAFTPRRVHSMRSRP